MAMTEQAAESAGHAARSTGHAARSTGHAARSTDQVRQLFDAKAATWPAKYAPGGPLTGRLARFADALAYHVPPGGRVLDLGCGTGDLACAATRVGLRVTACDISAQMLGRAAAGDPGGAVHWVQLDPRWHRLPFESGTFDAIVAASVLEYVARPGAVICECARVLRPGGIALCTVPDLTHPVRWLEWLAHAAARLPLVRAVGQRWPRLDGHLTYLRISHQRHGAGWWCAAAARAGLLTVPSPVGAPGHSPLRLLMFKRPTDSRSGQ
jgi:SAM-dependent methyltransferase